MALFLFAPVFYCHKIDQFEKVLPIFSISRNEMKNTILHLKVIGFFALLSIYSFFLNAVEDSTNATENSTSISATENSTRALGYSVGYENPYHHNNLAIAYNLQEGFVLIHSPIESMNIGGFLELDGLFFIGEDQPKSTFLIRRARIFMTGELYNVCRYMIQPRWDRHENFDLAYGWLETLHPFWARLRMGLVKEPFSLEALKFDLFRNFNELSLVIRNYCLIFDIGIMAYGDIFTDRIDYSLGFFNGRGRRLDNNNNKEMVGRLVLKLLASSSYGSLYLGFSGATGKFDEVLSGTEFVTQTFNPFWIWRDNSEHPVENHDTRIRLGMDLEWLAGSFYVSAEYLYTSWGKIRMGDQSAQFHGQGGYAECAYILTGEDKPRNGPLYPKHNFDPCKNHWGAWEIGARYQIFYASKKMITIGFAKGANFLHGPIFGLNWYLNPRVAIKLDGQYLWFNRTLINKCHKFRNETSFICRAQAVF